MPANIVKTAADERHWGMAKKRAEAEGQKGNWKYVMGIFRRMRGRKKVSESACVEWGTSEGVRKAWVTRKKGMIARQRGGLPTYTTPYARQVLGPYGAAKAKGAARAAILDAIHTPKRLELKSEKQVHAVLKKHGLVKSVQMGLGHGMETDDGDRVKHTLMSNDRRHLYLGGTAGMRQWFMKTHKMLGMNLPKGFTNWSPKQIEQSFLKLKNSKAVQRRIARWTKPVKS